ncbi:hypothetical protein M9H77_13573 [Catharanthus roseus]|uniref:Uncharacterized protein n=1 Tax=Catharanthus roseus TaxID=4058 RepID=A0ACC0BKV6_CATRO|nr:hypothetical protein M9H77_13573 [Catharanthus roseus]
MHRSRAPYKCGLFKTIYNRCETGFGRTQGYSSGYDLVFGSVRELHCTWLVPRMRASSNGVDDSDSGEWIHFERGVDRGRVSLREPDYGRCVLIRSDFPAALETLMSTGVSCKVLLVILSEVCFCVDPVSLSFFRCVLCAYTSSVAPGLGSRFETYSLVPRGTQIPYSATVDLVVGLGVSYVVSEP